MVPIVEVRLEGAQEAINALTRLEKAITGGASTLGHRIAKEGERLVIKLTPRKRNTQRAAWSRRNKPPIYKQWDIAEKLSQRGMYQAVIFNIARTKQMGGIALLGALEFGAKGHDIPKPYPGLLCWLQPRSMQLFEGGRREGRVTRGGGTVSETFSRRSAKRGYVYTQHVKHPGHKPFRMVSRARRQLQVTAAIMLRAFGTELAQEYAGLKVTVR